MAPTIDLSISDILELLSESPTQHSPTTKFHAVISKLSRVLFEYTKFNYNENVQDQFGQFGQVVFPLVQMGAVSSIDILSSIDELIIFAFYWVNRTRYRNVADIGANIGLHTILMSRLGWKVAAYEPDPKHLILLENNLSLNAASNVKVHPLAVSDKAGTAEFIRVLGNTTSSHLAGSKYAPYGELDKFKVSIADFQSVLKGMDFVKIDAEGHEKILIENTTHENYKATDMMIEVGSEINSSAIFKHLSSIKINIFSQKSGWCKVTSFKDMPLHYKEGSIFITQKSAMPWHHE